MVLEPGMEVECINGIGLAITGSRYIVDTVLSAFNKSMITLVGIERPAWKTAIIHMMMLEMGRHPYAPTAFEAVRFRPIRKTDISAFQKLTEIDKVLEEA